MLDIGGSGTKSLGKSICQSKIRKNALGNLTDMVELGVTMNQTNSKIVRNSTQ